MYKLYPYQEPIAGMVFSYMKRNPSRHPLLALPTGSGKTVIMADIIKSAIDNWPHVKILVLSHVKEILAQNYEAITFHTGKSIGVYSAGLGSRQIEQITVAGIQSIYKRPEDFKDYQLIIIDECHLIPSKSNSMYRSFLESLTKPRYLGLTATPYRLGSGLIYGKDQIFDDLILDLTYMDAFNKLIDDGYLCKLKAKPTDNEMDVNGIAMVNGDFSTKEMADKFNVDSKTKKCIDELIAKGSAYKKWLIFAIDINHAEAIAEELLRRDIMTQVVHSKMEDDRDFVIDNFKSGKYQAIVNVNVLTTGFNDPEIDLIALMRPTASPVIHVQTIGRGLRTAPGKDHCLIMDFAGNIPRLGPINDIHVHKKKKGKKGKPIVKICTNCSTFAHPRAKFCEFCGFEFPKPEVKLSVANSGAKEIVATNKLEWFDVDEVFYYLHQKANRPDSVRVSYSCNMRTFNEYVCLEHPGWTGEKGRHWAKYRGVETNTAKDLLSRINELKEPTRIKVDRRGKFPQVVDFQF